MELSVARLETKEPSIQVIHKEVLGQAQGLVLEEVVGQLMGEQKCQVFFLHP
jgi:hypothetical protein